ncbi:hypothetical protein NM688_g7027 [Phlebia brevispora]|uniref:Uncharacterized protein n=1 Tax=Phlebia brevispora TaxID=194682 RepID=A0ACC1S9W8_9APHY|nr:hypothetical protein NM688_g7027 [Phlebia brevispora]
MPPRPKHAAQSHRAHQQPAKRHFELIASVSRSSGLERDGDALRDFKTQQEYRDFIQDKLDEYWKQFPHDRSARDIKARDEIQANILIQFRKLREGILSTKRNDAFALEAYETSLYLTALFSSPVQTTSVISQLLPHMYLPYAALPSSSLPATIVSLVHFLLTAYPSQSRFFEHLGSLPSTFLPRSSDARHWLWDLARALRQRNYARLEQLTKRETFSEFLKDGIANRPPPSNQSQPVGPENLPLDAVCTLVDALRSKARETIWTVIRSAYRELSCPKSSNGSDEVESPTRVWLRRSLVLLPLTVLANGQNNISVVDDWLEKRKERGELRPKEGVEGRWLVLKAK